MKQVILILIAVALTACSKQLHRHGNETRFQEADYLIEMKAVVPGTVINDVLSSVRTKIIFNIIQIQDVVFIDQKEIQIRCNKISAIELNQLMCELMRCPGITELRQHKLTNNE